MKLLKLLSHRVVIITCTILLQLMILILMIAKFQEYFIYFYLFCLILSFIVILFIVNGNTNPGYKISWVILVLLLPIFGGIFYILFGGNRLSKSELKKIRLIESDLRNANDTDDHILDYLEQTNMNAYHQAYYMKNYASSSIYDETSSKFLSSGEIFFEHLKKELKGAKHYIFLEYFIIHEGKMWNEILEILKEKVAVGVDVRLIYDDMGCMMTLPYDYQTRMQEVGIKCEIFNPFIPILSTRFNNRDHRKIAIIDGYIGFTGGANLADEYINEITRFGHWKDTAILLKGQAVWNLTTMFLSMWHYLTDETEDFFQYRPQKYQLEPTLNDGYVQPYSDCPFDNETVGETVYLNMMHRANHYLYITTPYLIIDNEVVTALCMAAKTGVDVRIITPHIPDKRMVHAVTRAYYANMIENGVKIYEYTPGFIHSKTFVVDDEYATVGTVNLDYRSLYLHFECGVWLYQTNSVLEIKKDFLKTLEVCDEITPNIVKYKKWHRKLSSAVIRLFAPLM